MLYSPRLGKEALFYDMSYSSRLEKECVYYMSYSLGLNFSICRIPRAEKESAIYVAFSGAGNKDDTIRRTPRDSERNMFHLLYVIFLGAKKSLALVFRGSPREGAIAPRSGPLFGRTHMLSGIGWHFVLSMLKGASAVTPS